MMPKVFSHAHELFLPPLESTSRCVRGHLEGHVGVGALGEDGLRDHPGEGEHGEAAVHDLRELHTGPLLGVRAELERVQREVSGLAARVLVDHLVDADGGDDLEDGEPDDELLHRPVAERHVVGVDRAHLVDLARKLEAEVGGREAHDSELADAPMLQLSLAEPVAREPVGEAHRVEPVVAGHVVAHEGGRARKEGEGLAHGRRAGGGGRSLLHLRRGGLLRRSSLLGKTHSAHGRPGRGHEGRRGAEAEGKDELVHPGYEIICGVRLVKG
mmetsp:Transcript_47615/g.108018  ORF Transcript_47615/g.108018 Transcript_47615/m.108018 type:complete len:271 (+) Transcript_47615:315-1127(+)